MTKKTKEVIKKHSAILSVALAILIQIWFAGIRPFLNPHLTTEQLFFDNALPMAVTIALLAFAQLLARSAQDDERKQIES